MATPLVAVADLGSLLRWCGLLEGAKPSCAAIVCPDALVAEVLEFLRAHHDGRLGPMLADLVDVELSVRRFYASAPMASTLAEIASLAPADLDLVLCSPIALAAKLELPLATTSTEIATLAVRHVPQVILLQQ